ncbi:phosphoglycerate kinase [Mesorhizobium atlanticum]|uniref:Phosphoglycerate kinase n=1 Tax=Mesorhizobium atlanticum TaxID=2233532 RepID=A0A330GXI8_9HYPH|nr:phosphoglycerate kinase [Mesorhizobium atlanticum]RAZ77045.1 phosphoglycerate kinase [Mesorhizobium atlanticum]
MSALPDIRDADVNGRTVLVRADLNVPLKNGKVSDATRIQRFAPTVRDLLQRGAAVVVMTHLGRPGGEFHPAYSVEPVAEALAREIGHDVIFVPDCVGAVAERAAGHLGQFRQGEVLLLENLRFHKGEEENSRNFALRLSVNGDIYVNDAFSCAHRAHASTHAIAQLMPSFAGPSLLEEVAALTAALDKPVRPVAALVGGAKVSSKISILKNLATRMDHLIIGGGMANTFLAAQGHDVGRSLHEADCIPIALDILAVAAASNCHILLPDDVVVARKFAEDEPSSVVGVGEIPPDMMALDVGPRTVARIEAVLGTCRTLLWNGPLGAFETRPFGEATFAVANKAAELTEAGKLTTIAGGGDTAAALAAAGVADRISYLSTAGGAFLEWLEGRALPGIEILRTNTKRLEDA